MPINYTIAIKNSRLTVVANAIDAGSGPGKIRIYDYGKSTLLLEVPFEDPCYTSIADGILTFDLPATDPLAIANGTASEATIVTSANALVADGLTVGTSAAYDVQLNALSLVATQPCKIISASISHG